MNRRPTFEEFKEEVMKDPAVRAAYEALRPEFEALAKSIRARIKRNRKLRLRVFSRRHAK